MQVAIFPVVVRLRLPRYNGWPRNTKTLYIGIPTVLYFVLCAPMEKAKLSSSLRDVAGLPLLLFLDDFVL